jgi:hypothetical protein
LGRSGDTIDYNGHLKAVDNIAKIFSKERNFLFFCDNRFPEI